MLSLIEWQIELLLLVFCLLLRE